MTQPHALAPELSDRLTWINTEPLPLGRCTGRVVALVFFNQASAYAQNLIDAMHYLALRHPQQLQVIGIHVPKYPFERDPARVSEAVSRFNIRFPVASDADYVVWQHYGIKGWPSLAVIDSTGELRRTIAGDLPAEALEAALAPLIDEAPVVLEGTSDAVAGRRQMTDESMSHPEGLAVGENRLYIADTAHHQVLECTLEGRVLTRYGTGEAGLADGSARECAFHSPRGLLLHRESLYIADSGNHAIRWINLRTAVVETLAGTGRPGSPDPDRLESPRELDLNRPHGLATDGERIYVSLAGLNQIWAYELSSGAFTLVAGNGEFGVDDGPASQASFAHPAGLAVLNNNTLYIVDSASAALRRLTLGDGEVRTLVSGGLFDFGCQDGPREQARFQHPLAIALQYEAAVLWIADSGNDRIRTLRLGGGPVDSPRFETALVRPAALASSEGALWVANTDCHRILRVDTASGEVADVDIVDSPT